VWLFDSVWKSFPESILDYPLEFWIYVQLNWLLLSLDLLKLQFQLELMCKTVFSDFFRKRFHGGKLEVCRMVSMELSFEWKAWLRSHGVILVIM